MEKLAVIVSKVRKNYENADVQNYFKEEHENKAFWVFKEGLREPLKLLIKASNANNLTEAIALAIEEEPYSRQNAEIFFYKTQLSVNKFFKVVCENCGR